METEERGGGTGQRRKKERWCVILVSQKRVQHIVQRGENQMGKTEPDYDGKDRRIGGDYG